MDYERRMKWLINQEACYIYIFLYYLYTYFFNLYIDIFLSIIRWGVRLKSSGISESASTWKFRKYIYK